MTAWTFWPTSRPDLQDIPLIDAVIICFTDDSSFIQEGQRYAPTAVVPNTEIIWAEPLLAGTSSQKAEKIWLIALTKASELGQDKRLDTYTDSLYAFAYIHRAI